MHNTIHAHMRIIMPMSVPMHLELARSAYAICTPPIPAPVRPAPFSPNPASAGPFFPPPSVNLVVLELALSNSEKAPLWCECGP